jgi:hypothetical protein
MQVSVHAVDEVRPNSKGKVSSIGGTPNIRMDRAYDGTIRLIMSTDGTEYLGSGERGGDSREISRHAVVYLDEKDISQLIGTLARGTLPRLQTADALTLAMGLIKGTLEEHTPVQPSRAHSPTL